MKTKRNAKALSKIAILFSLIVLFLSGKVLETKTFADENHMVFGFNAVEGGIVWYQYDGTLLKNSWLTFDGKQYYFDENGYIVRGTKVINGITYEFGSDCALITTASAPETTPAGTTVAAGYECTRAQLKANCDYVIAQATTEAMDPFTKLKFCYQYIIDHTSYVRTYETPAGDWTPSFANQVLVAGTGNCYRYAAAFAYLAKDLGFETKIITGMVPSKKGGQTPHSWTEVFVNDNYYIFDTELEDANHNDYFMKTYKAHPFYDKQVEWPVTF